MLAPAPTEIVPSVVSSFSKVTPPARAVTVTAGLIVIVLTAIELACTLIVPAVAVKLLAIVILPAVPAAVVMLRLPVVVIGPAIETIPPAAIDSVPSLVNLPVLVSENAGVDWVVVIAMEPLEATLFLPINSSVPEIIALWAVLVSVMAMLIWLPA